MIPTNRIAVPADTRRLLDRRTENVKNQGGTSTVARAEWGKARAAKQHVRRLLEQMAHGVQRCMYCEDSLGTDIDHFDPIAVAPLRTFEWNNHLLACSYCNSNYKRDEYPCDTNGACLLVNPSIEDPADHLTLLLASGEYVARTAKGEATIRVFGLNRNDLVRGRKAAFWRARAVLCEWHLQWQESQVHEAAQLADALQISPFSNVVRVMGQLKPNVAASVLGAKTVAAVNEWRGLYGPTGEG